MPITDDLQKLLDILPQEIRQVIEQHQERDSLIEVVMDLGRRPSAPAQSRVSFSTAVTSEQLNYCIQRVDTLAAITEQELRKPCTASAPSGTGREIIGLTSSWSGGLRIGDPRPGGNRSVDSDAGSPRRETKRRLRKLLAWQMS